MALSRRKNDEAPTTCDSQGLLSNKSREGNIDMNSVQNNELTFHNTTFSYMEMAGQIWLTAAEVGEALGYSDDKAIHRLYRKHADEFTVNMTGVVKVTTPGGVQDSRVFSLRGAHLMGMFSRTTVAKEFRRWVLDILDREVVTGNISPTFDFEMHAKNALVAEEHFKYVYMVWKESIRPALRCTGSPLAVSLEDRFKAISAITFGLSCALSKQEKNWGIH